MFVDHTFLFTLVLLLVAVAVEPLSHKLKIPYPAVLVFIGFVGSEFTTYYLGIDIGIDWQNFDELILYGLVPILIFQSAIALGIQSIKSNFWPVFCLGCLGALLATLIAATLIYFGIDSPSGFPWIAALLVGFLVSATDPSAMLNLFRTGDFQHLSVILRGESLLNDTIAIIFFGLIISMISSGSLDSMIWSVGVLKLMYVFFGGGVIGVLAGFTIANIQTRVTDAQAKVLLTIICAYGVFVIAERYLNVSGVIAVLVSGLILGYHQDKLVAADKKCIDTVWRFAAKLAESLIFLLGGVTVTVAMFKSQWLAMVIAIVAILIARAGIVFIFLALMCRFYRQVSLGYREQVLLFFGGARGTVTLALALSLPLSLEYWYTIQSMAYGVVLFTLFFQTLALQVVLTYFKRT